MAEACPAPAALEAFAAGSLPERERAEVEAHLGRCLACVEALDRLTSAQLNSLLGGGGFSTTLPTPAGPVLQAVMRLAAESGAGSARPNPKRVLELLDPSAATDALGAFAGYDVLGIAGRGGMGVVLKARDGTLDRLVAIKVILPSSGDDESFTARFLDEARAVAAIHHDHIVTVHQAGMVKGLAYLVMPFHAEGTLEGQLAKTPKFAPADVARVGLQLARALAATHAQNILHRDLKPSNVLLEQGLKRVRLADFGLARAHVPGGGKELPQSKTPAQVQSASRTIAGTPHYMPPEQARGETIDARSDLFGLGAVLFQMATGQTLYAGESSKEVLQAATRCELKPVREVAPEVPSALAIIIDRLLARRPEERPASAEKVVSELERFINRAHRLRLWLQRAAVVTLAVFLALSAGIFALDWSGRTAIVNALLCERSGEGYFIRGRFGTFAHLPDAVAAARPHDVIEARFSGEQLVDNFRVGGKPLTIRAARGFTPVLLATNNAQPLILADAPLALEGLTIWRRGPVVNFPALFSVEDAPLHLLNCRLLRSRFQGQDVLVWGRLRVVALNEPQPARPYRALLAFQHGSTGHLRNCVVAGTQAGAIELRASTNRPIRVETTNSLFVVDRVFGLNPEAAEGIDLESNHSVFVTGVLLDLKDTLRAERISLSWRHCLVDRTQGALVRVNQLDDGTLLRGLEWKETNVVYAGQGAFVLSRQRRALDSEAQWNEWLRLPPNSHRFIDRLAFPETCVRSSLALSSSDLDAETLREMNASRTRFNPAFVGEGVPYEKFRGARDYREWQRHVRASVQDWELRRNQATPSGNQAGAK
jgi:anti-sigma factor RsiW